MSLPTRFLISAGATLLLSLLSLPGHTKSGLYLGGSLGNAKVGSPEGMEYTVDNEDLRNFDDSDIGYKVYGGLKFTLLAVEAGYVNFGAIENGDAQIEIDGFNAFGILSMGLGPVEIFGKAGAFVWQSDVSLLEEQFDEDGFDPVVGVGAAVNLGGVGVRAEYEYYKVSDFDEVSMLSLGATFWF